MLTKRSRVVRCAMVLGSLAAALVLVPPASAGVRVGFSFNIALPPGVMVSVGNYEPFYVGRAFYQPLGVWRPVYSFPVMTPYGLVYEPYIYDGARVVCHDFIPGPEAGYGAFIIEGRGHYDPKWYRPPHGYARGSYYQNRGWSEHGHGWDEGRAYSWNHDSHGDRTQGRGHGHQGKNRKHDHR